MIYIIDDFLDTNVLRAIDEDRSDFIEHKTPGKSFWVKIPPKEFTDLVIDKLSKQEGVELENVLAFFREAKLGQDNDWRIHSDSIIYGVQPDRAAVLYLSEKDEDVLGLKGTAFWSHIEQGDTYKTTNIKDYDDMLLNQANNIDNWKLETIIGHKKNRLLSYPCKYFHSKYPKEYKNSRIVFVIFYKIKDKDE